MVVQTLTILHVMFGELEIKNRIDTNQNLKKSVLFVCVEDAGRSQILCKFQSL